MLHGFFDFENFDLDEYEHYEVKSFDEWKFNVCFFYLIESRKW